MRAKTNGSSGRSTKDDLIDAAKQLFYKHGYDGTSPRLIQEASHAGQGSFYHHFAGKIDLAQAALQSILREETARFDDTFAAKSPLALIMSYLEAPREALRGCRLGRFAYETSFEHAQINEPVVEYFRFVQGRLTQAVAEAQRQHLLEPGVDPERTAVTLLAVVQGAFILARAHGRQDIFDDALAGARGLIEGITIAPHGREEARAPRGRSARSGSTSKG